MRTSDRWGGGGFSLRIVDAVTDRWGSTPSAGATRVWFVIDY